MSKFARKVDIRDKEAWVVAVCTRVLKIATSGYPYLTGRDVNRICDYLKERFGAA
jgi:hypothetical protein